MGGKMGKQSKRDSLYDLIKPKVTELAYRCVDVDFEKAGKDWVLTIYIDQDQGIGIDDCEKVSRYLSDYLDEVDPIEQSYLLEVSSPGLDRPFKRMEQYENAIDTMVDLRLFSAVNGTKELTGTLVSVDDQGIKITNEKGDTVELAFKAISKASPHIEF